MDREALTTLIRGARLACAGSGVCAASMARADDHAEQALVALDRGDLPAVLAQLETAARCAAPFAAVAIAWRLCGPRPAADRLKDAGALLGALLERTRGGR